ncbi:helix-turn-helix transcriptional regulator [Actinocatenispora sera]|uniref:helix-turn-helix domain-containing protein n=1 Tax=Actinocatenispora sera TaxID=390989 RepID=UPI00340CF3B4
MTSAQRARVGAELRRIRLAEGLSGEDVGAALGWSQSKVSRIETGRFGVSIPDLSALLSYYGVPEEVKAELLSTAADDAGIDGAWIVRAGGTPRRQGEVQAVETQLKRFRQHHPLLVPGQLQSEEYARENARLGGWPDPDGIARRRMLRQQLLEGKGAPRYEVILDARALWYWPGDRSVMKGQIEHLIERAALASVTLRVIPFGVDRSAVAMAPFILYDFTKQTSPPVVFLEAQTSDTYLSDPKDVQTYSELFDKLATDALDHAESINYVASLGKEIQSHRSRGGSRGKRA